MIARMLAALGATATVLAGCGGQDPMAQAADTAPHATVLPLSRVEVGDVSVVPDPSHPDRALLHVRTSRPMICAVVWGTTTGFGNLDDSTDMGGTGLTVHDVSLPGVRPGVPYVYLVEGATADGTLYRSTVGLFTLPASAATTPPHASSDGADLARGARVVAVSSAYSAAFAAANAVDGDPSTEWATRGDGNRAFITIDLGAPMRIGAVEFVTRSMADGSAITSSYGVVVDGGHMFGPFPAGTPADPRPSPLAVTGRILRFQVLSSTGGNTGAIEVRVLPPGGRPS